MLGFQWTNRLQNYRKNRKYANLYEYILLFQKKVLPLQQQNWRIYTIRIIPLCKHSGGTCLSKCKCRLFLFANNNINSIHKNSISSVQLSAHGELFSKKIPQAGSDWSSTLPACILYNQSATLALPLR